jgi:hypothetical protein
MSIIYPDGSTIANLGSVSVEQRIKASFDGLAEYAIYARVSKEVLFKDLAYTWSSADGGQYQMAPLAQGETAIDAAALRDAFSDKAVHFQLGSRYDIMRLAFPLGSAHIDNSSGAASLAHRRLAGEGATVRLYGVFLDEYGYPVRHWREVRDGFGRVTEVELLYEYFGTGQDAFTASHEVSAGLKTALFAATAEDTVILSGINTSDETSPDTLINIVSGPADVELGIDPDTGNAAARSRFQNALTLTGSTVRLKGVSYVPDVDDLGQETYPQVRWLGKSASTHQGEEGSGSMLTTLRLVRASLAGVQTLVFAVVCDDSTSDAGMTDVLPVMRRFVADTAGGDFDVHAVAPSLIPGDDGRESRVAFMDPDFRTYRADSPFVAKPLFSQARGAIDLDGSESGVADPMGRALPMFFPPVQVATSSEPDLAGSNPFTWTSVNVLNFHKAMPRATLGERLLQMYSVAVGNEEGMAEATEANLSESVVRLFDIGVGIGSSYDIRGEDLLTHEIVARGLDEYLSDADKCKSFLNDFGAKYPGVLLQASPSGVARVRDAIVAAPSPKSFSLVLYVNLRYSVNTAARYQASDVSDGGLGIWLRDVPVVIQLVDQ